MAHHLYGLCALGQDVQQVSGGDEVEAGEGQSLGLKVVSQSLLTQCQSAHRRGGRGGRGRGRDGGGE